MTLNEQIMAILATLGVPVGYMTYKGTATTYIRFSIYDEYGNNFADDAEIDAEYRVQVDTFGKGNIDQLAKRVKDTMLEAGFSRSGYYENYENGTGFYQKTYRFTNIIENMEVLT
jgi:hypothetical protein